MDEETGCIAILVLLAFYLVGASVASVLSWDSNHSILWLSLHAFASWAYVISRVVSFEILILFGIALLAIAGAVLVAVMTGVKRQAATDIVNTPARIRLLEWVDSAPSPGSRMVRLCVCVGFFLCPVLAILAFIAAV